MSGGSDGSVKVWDLRAGRLVQFYEAHAGAVTSLSCHPSGSFLLTASLDGTLKVGGWVGRWRKWRFEARS